MYVDLNNRNAVICLCYTVKKGIFSNDDIIQYYNNGLVHYSKENIGEMCVIFTKKFKINK